jgi:phage terminase small subunit
MSPKIIGGVDRFFLSYKTAPKHLSSAAKSWWRALFKAYAIDEPASLILRVALESWDRLNEASGAVKKDGLVISDHLGTRAHPALRVEKEARSGFLQSWRLLNFDVDPPGPMGRPPRRPGFRGVED